MSGLEITCEMQEALTKGLSPLTPMIGEDILKWCESNYILAEESSAIAGPFKAFPYQKAVLYAYADDDVESIAVCKSAQTGFTKLLVAYELYSMVQRRRNLLHYMPGDPTVEAYVMSEINPLLQVMPVFAGAMKADLSKPDRRNSLHRKELFGATGEYLSGLAASNFRMRTADCLVFDELAGLPQSIQGEAHPVALGEDRIQTSSFPKTLMVSTPVAKTDCLIQEQARLADQRFARIMPCAHCGTGFTNTHDNLTMLDGGMPDPEGTFTCHSCGGVNTYQHHKERDEAGWWQSADFKLLDDGTFIDIETGVEAVAPPVSMAFVDLTSYYSYFRTYKQTVGKYYKALKQIEDTGVQTLMAAYYTTNLGQGFSITVGDEVNHGMLQSNVMELPWMEIPVGTVALTMGVDVHKSRLDFVIIAWRENMQGHVVLHKKLHGDAQRADSAVWAELDSYRTEYYGGVPITLTLVDYGYMKDTVFSYAETDPQRVLPCRGMEKQDAQTQVAVDSTGLSKVKVDNYSAKMFIQKGITTEPGSYGSITFNSHISEEFLKEVTSEHLVQKANGELIWDTKSVGRDNHALDCVNYATAAWRVLGGAGVMEKQVEAVVQESSTGDGGFEFMDDDDDVW